MNGVHLADGNTLISKAVQQGVGVDLAHSLSIAGEAIKGLMAVSVSANFSGNDGGPQP